MTRDELGSLTVWFAVLAGALFACAGLVAAGGEALAVKARAESQAFAAARAGAEALAPSSLAAGTPELDGSTAYDAAAQSLARDGARGEVSVAGQTVAVTVHADVDGGLLALVGVRTLTVSGSARASVVTGS